MINFGQITGVSSLLNADQIFAAESDVITSARPGDSIYISHYSLPLVHEGDPVRSRASIVQREILDRIRDQLEKGRVKVFIIADNSEADKREGDTTRRNEETIQYLHEQGAYVLSYPSRFVSINHTKFVAREGRLVITSANLSSHSADSPDDNSGFSVVGRGAHNGIVRSFASQWNFSAREDTRGWAEGYPNLELDPGYLYDEKVFWLNTAPREETGHDSDSTEIFDAYRRLIQRAASGPSDGYLYFEHFDLSNAMLQRHLLYAHHVNPTLDIRFILDPNQYLEGLRASEYDMRVVVYNEVKAAGIPIRFARVKPHPNGSADPQRFHDKYVVYNDREAINGSGNLSNHSLNGNGPLMTGAPGSNDTGNENRPDPAAKPLKPKKHNREVDVLVRDADSARALKEKFVDDWVYNSFEDPVVASGEGLKKGGANT